MKPTFEKLVPRTGESFRCFDRSELRSPAKWHRHPEIELTYVPIGSGSRIVGDHIGSYTDHDLVLIGSQIPHTWASDEYLGKASDRHHAIVLQFHPEFLGVEFFECGEMARIDALLKRSQQGLWYPAEVAHRVGAQMEALVTTKGAKRLLGLFSILHELSIYDDPVPLSTQSFDSRNGSAARVSPARRAAETKIQTVCDHIANHLADSDLTQMDLADLIDMNPSAFTRFFRQSTGRTPLAYISELRIGLACRLLTDTDESILAICNQSGFANLSNFNRQFRKRRSTTPRDYRSRFRGVT
ncbi:Arabinose operon regulatory protein [Rubripirellula tenax]|uniref:Arabinose operon regulatory protein n=1 Tax=Rubripirellula tenax TaxID=2528015 RepID=A0A5C6EIK0_9BACT|nr:AraC family transcriptional regulator [Rubripirellula tenax]TWU47471.1 Arabinose operon regulatory protein [Rubripirellula tenax]